MSNSGPSQSDKIKEYQELSRRVQRRQLLRTATNLKQFAAALERNDDYPTESARHFCSLILHTAKLTAERADKIPEAKIPIVVATLQFFGSLLRYAERSRIEHTPWSMIQAVESFLRRHTGTDHCFILRPQWRFNYSILPDLVGVFRQMIEAHADWLPIADWDAAIGSLAGIKLGCISFPRLERNNALMHINWGHEVGHVVAASWIDNQFDPLWQTEEPAIQATIQSEYAKSIPKNFPPAIAQNSLNFQVAEGVKETMELTRFGITELISDLVGCHLFGPAALVAQSDFAAGQNLDTNPLQCGKYPPWRMRLRRLASYVSDDCSNAKLSGCLALQPFLDRIDLYDSLTKQTDDIDSINGYLATREAYKLIDTHWTNIQAQIQQILQSWKSQRYRVSDRMEVVADLVARIREGLPPNESGIWPSSQPATLPDILSAAWAFVCKCESENPQWGSAEEYENLCHLVLKGVEASFLAIEYGPRILAAENQ